MKIVAAIDIDKTFQDLGIKCKNTRLFDGLSIMPYLKNILFVSSCSCKNGVVLCNDLTIFSENSCV